MKLSIRLLLSGLMLTILISQVTHAQIRDRFRSNTVTMFDPTIISTWIQQPTAVSDAERAMNARGSMYLYDDWREGTLIMKNDTMVEGLKLRYNIYTRQMHFIYQQDTLALIVPEKVKYAVLENEAFVWTDFLEDNLLKKDYFQILAEGKARLLLHRKVKFDPRNPPATPYSTGTEYDRFLRFEYTYIQKENEPAVQLKRSRGGLMTCFADKSQEIKQFMRKERIRPKKTGDLIKVVQFYNKLISG